MQRVFADNTSTMSCENNRSERIETLKELYLKKYLPLNETPSSRAEMNQLHEENVIILKHLGNLQKRDTVQDRLTEVGASSAVTVEQMDCIPVAYSKQLIDNLVEEIIKLKTELKKKESIAVALEMVEDEKKMLATVIHNLHKSRDGAGAVCKKATIEPETDFTDDVNEIVLSVEEGRKRKIEKKRLLEKRAMDMGVELVALKKLVQNLQHKIIGQAQIMADLRSGLTEKYELVEVLNQQVMLYEEDFQIERRDREYAQQNNNPSQEYRAILELDLREQKDIQASLKKQVAEKTEQLEMLQEQMSVYKEEFQHEQHTRRCAEKKIIDLTEKFEMNHLRNTSRSVHWLDLQNI